MAETSETVETLKTASDGFVKIAIEKYNEMAETIASQKSSISQLQTDLNRLRNQPPTVNRRVVEKTVEMAAADHRAWGTTLMGLGASMLVVGAVRFRLGHSGS